MIGDPPVHTYDCQKSILPSIRFVRGVYRSGAHLFILLSCCHMVNNVLASLCMDLTMAVTCSTCRSSEHAATSTLAVPASG